MCNRELEKIKIRDLGTSGRNCLAHTGVCFKSPPIEELVIEDKAVQMLWSALDSGRE